jgi:S-DNA-T family DNA segregation ATPase FtsK/SpoIIIE
MWRQRKNEWIGEGEPGRRRKQTFLFLVSPQHSRNIHKNKNNFGGAAVIEGMFMELFKQIAIWGIIFGLPVLALCRTDKTEKLMRNCGIKNKDDKVPIVYDKKKKEYGYDLTLHLPEGLCLSDIQKHQEAIETNLNAKVELLPSTNQKMILKAYTKQLKQLYPYEKVETKGLSFPLGYSHKGLVIHTMDDENPHLLIGGTSGSGKSCCLRATITHIIQTKPDIKLHLCDLKGGIEFAIFKRSKQVQTFAKNLQEATEQLLMLKEEMYKRFELFEQQNVVNLTEYNRKIKDKLPKHLLIIDELANITLESANLTEVLNELLRMARACGIHIIVSTQRPSADVLPGILKCNILATVAFKVRNHVNSEILIDHKGAEDLKGKGHGIYQTSNEIEFQGLFISAKDAVELIKHTYIEKKPQNEEVGRKRRDNSKRSASA